MQARKFFIKNTKIILSFLLTTGCVIKTNAQALDSSSAELSRSVNQLSDRSLKRMTKEYATLEAGMQKQTTKALSEMQAKENILQKKLMRTDSVKALSLLADTKAKYAALQQQVGPSAITSHVPAALRNYMPGLDSMQTATKFLQQKGINISPERLQQLNLLNTHIQGLQQQAQRAGELQTFAQQRQAQLKQAFSNFPVAKQLTGINKTAFYYQQHIAQYRDLVNNKEKLKQSVLKIVTAQPAFQKFWQRNSLLCRVFPLPDEGTTNADSAIAGLQTKSQVGAVIQQKLGKTDPDKQAATGSSGGATYLNQQVQQARSELDQLKNKLAGVGNGSSDVVMPDFNPNSQKTKSFLKRIECGFNLQNTPGTSWLPATSDVAGTIGYKINDKATAGIGVAYKLGWGAPIKDIHFSSQGIGLRSFGEIKAKGSLWITGGFEYNYLQAFSDIAALRQYSNWQKSVLAGLSKKYKVGGKTANLQLLYDFLATAQTPKSIPVKFRVGYTF